MNCVYCNSENVRKCGFLRSGAQRYFCKDCKKGFSTLTKVKPKLEEPKNCPICGSKMVKAGKDKNSTQRYLCRKCNKKFNDLQTGFRHPKESSCKDMICPFCGKKTLVKRGKEEGRQRYSCNSCGKSYMDNPSYTHITSQQKEVIKQYVLNGKNIKWVADKLKCCEKTVRSIVDPYLKEEIISEQQKSLIMQFGVGCNVPVNYLAEYVKCSERMCSKIIKKYEKRPNKVYKLTEQEKYFDRYELEKFMRW